MAKKIRPTLTALAGGVAFVGKIGRKRSFNRRMIAKCIDAKAHTEYELHATKGWRRRKAA